MLEPSFKFCSNCFFSSDLFNHFSHEKGLFRKRLLTHLVFLKRHKNKDYNVNKLYVQQYQYINKSNTVTDHKYIEYFGDYQFGIILTTSTEAQIKTL